MRRAKCVASNRITRHGAALSAYYGSVQLLADQGEVEGQPVSVSIREHVDGQLSLTAEPQVYRQAGDQRLHRVADVLSRNPLPCTGQCVARFLPHIGQVHRFDAVRDGRRSPCTGA